MPPDWTAGYVGIGAGAPGKKGDLRYGSEVYRLNEALLETTARLQKTEADRADATARLAKAAVDSVALEASTEARRARLAELLAALQRLTRDAPPALFVAPDDMVSAVRAAGVVGGLVGDIQAEADSLSGDLAKIADLKQQIEQERSGLAASAEQLALDKTRLAALIDARQKALADRAGALDAERRRADQLAQQAGTLKDLIGRMDGDAAAASAADRAATAALEPRAPAAGRDSARLQPAVAFSDLKGRLPWPATILRSVTAPGQYHVICQLEFSGLACAAWKHT